MKTLLVLGAAVWEDGASPTLRRRTLRAVDLYRAGDVAQVIPCGGLGRFPPSEAEAMRRILVASGVPDCVIRLEDRSTNTLENIRFALPFLSGPDVVIVTDWYHGPRAWMTARHLGLRPRMRVTSLKGAHPVQQVKGALRELAAILVYWWRLRRD